MSHAMEESDRVAAAILAKLYHEGGLARLDLDVNAIAKQCAQSGETEEGQHHRAAAVVPGVIEYLEDEGLISVGSRSKYIGHELPEFRDVALRKGGLRALRAMPASIDEENTDAPIGDRIGDAIQGGSWGIAAQLFREVLKLVQRA